MYCPRICQFTGAITPPGGRLNLHHRGPPLILRGLIVISGGKLVENSNELVQQGLAFETKKEVLEILVGQIDLPAAVLPELHRGDMWIFLFHTMLDSLATQMMLVRMNRRARNSTS